MAKYTAFATGPGAVRLAVMSNGLWTAVDLEADEALWLSAELKVACEHATGEEA